LKKKGRKKDRKKENENKLILHGISYIKWNKTKARKKR
jgi:hypothetical protein